MHITTKIPIKSKPLSMEIREDIFSILVGEQHGEKVVH
jgi:hypothetical protein